MPSDLDIHICYISHLNTRNIYKLLRVIIFHFIFITILKMISRETQERLAFILINIGEGDQDIEVVRQVLSEISSFEPYSTFHYLDKNRNGLLTSSDFLEFLFKNNYRAIERDVYMLIREWDSDSDGKISFGDFEKWILPQQSKNLRVLAARRMQLNLLDLPYEVEYAFMRILEREIAYLKRLEDARQDLERMHDFNMLDCFQTIDDYRLSYLNVESIQRFLRRNGYNPTDEIMQSIIIRLDKNGDSKVTYSEFVDGIAPTQPFSKIGMGNSGYLSTRSHYLTSPSPYKSYNSTVSSVLSKSSSSISSLRSSRNALSPERNNKSNFKNLSARSSVDRNVCNDYESKELAKFLNEQITLDKELETMRQELALRVDFTIADAFKMLESQTYKGFITELQLDSELRALNLHPSANDIYMLFRQYDKNSDGKLTFSDLCEMLTPRQCDYSKLLNSRPTSNLSSSKRKCALSIETQELLSRVFKKIFDIENASEAIRQRITNNPYLNVNDLFSKIDKDYNGNISIDGFRKIMHDNGIYPTGTELTAILSRYDRNKDGKVSYKEFIQEITPRSPSHLN